MDCYGHCRSLQLDEASACSIDQTCHECMECGGVLLVQPEHLLLFQLMVLDQSIVGKTAVAEILSCTQAFFDISSRDIGDGSDENFNVKFELIYTIGSQRSAEAGPGHWDSHRYTSRLRQRPRRTSDGTSTFVYDEAGCASRGISLSSHPTSGCSKTPGGIDRQEGLRNRFSSIPDRQTAPPCTECRLYLHDKVVPDGTRGCFGRKFRLRQFFDGICQANLAFTKRVDRRWSSGFWPAPQTLVCQLRPGSATHPSDETRGSIAFQRSTYSQIRFQPSRRSRTTYAYVLLLWRIDR
jgi:hypothetical protein